MTTSYPTALDTLTNPAAGDSTSSPSHAAQHANANDAIEAIEAKLGTGSATPGIGKALTSTATGASGWQAKAAVDVRDYGTVGNGSTDDTAAIVAACAGGGTVLFPAGNYKISGSGLTLPAGTILRGAGRESTTLTGAAGMTGTMLTLGNDTTLCDMAVSVPSTLTSHAILLNGSSNAALRDLFVTGGGDAGIYLIAAHNSFLFRIENILITTHSNGLRLANTDGVFFYGNAAISQVAISLLENARIGVDIEGYQGGNTKNMNLMVFNYLSVIVPTPLTGAGSTGMKIVNTSNTVFSMLDIERCETSLDITGQVSSGGLSRGNVFVVPFLDANVSLAGAASSVRNTSFHGGQIQGTITQTTTDTRHVARYYGTVDVSGALLESTAQASAILKFSLTPGGFTVAAGTYNLDLTVSGIAAGDCVLVTPPTLIAGVLMSDPGIATSSTNVRVHLYNVTAGPLDVVAGTWKVLVIKKAI